MKKPGRTLHITSFIAGAVEVSITRMPDLRYAVTVLGAELAPVAQLFWFYADAHACAARIAARYAE